jgi:hypothetical protein
MTSFELMSEHPRVQTPETVNPVLLCRLVVHGSRSTTGNKISPLQKLQRGSALTMIGSRLRKVSLSAVVAASVERRPV